ncbi:MAG: hypothetical protein J5I59_00855 [Saprospiraceae bacterium]|nr:hypothetical protein [Saprospiraceae bacterium]
MTLGEFITWIGSEPQYIVGYFILIPVLAALMWFIAKDQGHLSPWKYVYSVLVYAVCIPGVTAIAFNLYLFAFQRQDIFATEIFTQLLSILSMVITLLLIRKNVDFELIPGFSKISNLITIIASVLLILWLGDKVRIFSFTYVPLWMFIVMFVGLIILIRYAWAKLF